MGRIAGVIFPDVFQTGNHLGHMLEVMKRSTEKLHRLTFHAQHLGQTGAPIFYKEAVRMGIVFDGMLFHRSKTFEALAKHGVCFAIEEQAKLCDEEICLYAYKIWGADFPRYIDGDFAFCLLDRDKEIFLLGRDRIGKKPLYWYQGQKHFLFASELKALLATGVIPATVAPEALATYLALGYFPQDLTPIAHVNKLLPGYTLLIDKEHALKIHSYWSYSETFLQRPITDKTEICRTLDHLLAKSVTERIGGLEGKTAAFMSGGLGSASVAYYLREANQELPHQAVTTAFRGVNEQDAIAAEVFARSLHLPLQNDRIEPADYLEQFIPMVWHLDEPLADATLAATWQLCSSAKEYPSIFSGMGSDELLAGHNRYTVLEREMTPMTKFWNMAKLSLRKYLVPFLATFRSEEAFRLLQHTRVNPYLVQYLYQNHLFHLHQLKQVSPNLSALFDPDVYLAKFHKIHTLPSLVSAYIYLDMKTRLPDQFILQYERFSRAFGQTWHTPYLDVDLITYASSIKEPQKMEESETATYLKELFHSRFPQNVLDRPKRTRRNFLGDWIVSADLKTAFLLLKQGTLVETGLISEEWLDRMLSSRERMRRGFRYLYAILVLEVWFRLYINRPIVPEPPSCGLLELLRES